MNLLLMYTKCGKASIVKFVDIIVVFRPRNSFSVDRFDLDPDVFRGQKGQIIHLFQLLNVNFLSLYYT